jgi:hypothetical protein
MARGAPTDLELDCPLAVQQGLLVNNGMMNPKVAGSNQPPATTKTLLLKGSGVHPVTAQAAGLVPLSPAIF